MDFDFGVVLVEFDVITLEAGTDSLDPIGPGSESLKAIAQIITHCLGIDQGVTLV
jgi:hypothetical protein